jgi:hypothetical protein
MIATNIFIKTTQLKKVAEINIIQQLAIFGPVENISYENSPSKIKYVYISEFAR